jgi:opacity protein-like surface antigen
MPSGWNFTSLACSVTGSGGTGIVVSGQLATITLKANDSVLCTFVNITSGSFPTPSSITIVKKTLKGRDGSFGFISNIPGGTSFTLTTSETIASTIFSGLANGVPYTVTESTPGLGWSLSDLSCTSSSSVNIGTRTATITLSGGVGVTCTFTNAFDDEGIRQRTSETIRNFMNRRADLITSEEPDRNRFIRRLTGSLWGSSSSDGAPFAFSGSTEGLSGGMRFSTSLSQIAQAANKANSVSGADKTYRSRPLDSEWNPDIDIWLEAHYNYFKEDRIGYGRNGNFGIVYLGADYLYTPNVLVGALIQIDSMTDSWKSTGASVSGLGWMAGPYISARLANNLFFDGRVAWGESSNSVNPFGAYSDKFDTQRSLARANLTGNWRHDAFRFTPSIGVTYFNERQLGYVDSLNVFIPSQSISLGRLSFGPEFGYRFVTSANTIVEPHIAVTGLWDFVKDRTMTIQGVVTGVQDIRAKIQGGVLIKNSNDLSMRWTVSYDGIGDRSLNVYGAQLWLSAPLVANNLPAARARAPFDWTGRYLGAHFGLSHANFGNEFISSGEEDAGAEGGSNKRQTKPFAGLFAGYNQLIGRFVIGGEADISFRQWKRTGEVNVFTFPDDADDGFFVSNRLGTTASFRGRWGYAWDKSLLYMTGGFALGRIRTDIRAEGGPDQDLPDTTYTQTSWRAGWTAGLGLEHAINSNWFGRGEFRYTKFGGSLFSISDPALGEHGPNSNYNSVSLTEALLGIGYRF